MQRASPVKHVIDLDRQADSKGLRLWTLCGLFLPKYLLTGVHEDSPECGICAAKAEVEMRGDGTREGNA